MKYLVKGGYAKFHAAAEIKISDDQAAARAHMVEPIAKKSGWYTCLCEVQFKPGEEIEIAAKPDDLAGQHRAVLFPAGKKKSPAKKKPAQKAKSPAPKSQPSNVTPVKAAGSESNHASA